jgi:hypothetical protein
MLWKTLVMNFCSSPRSKITESKVGLCLKQKGYSVKEPLPVRDQQPDQKLKINFHNAESARGEG